MYTANLPGCLYDVGDEDGELLLPPADEALVPDEVGGGPLQVSDKATVD
jgi:hypothetical protein